jgi:hypothetical protein
MITDPEHITSLLRAIMADRMDVQHAHVIERDGDYITKAGVIAKPRNADGPFSTFETTNEGLIARLVGWGMLA